MNQFLFRGIPVRLFRSVSSSPGRWAPGEPEAMLAEFERMLDEFRPDVLLEQTKGTGKAPG